MKKLLLPSALILLLACLLGTQVQGQRTKKGKWLFPHWASALAVTAADTDRQSSLGTPEEPLAGDWNLLSYDAATGRLIFQRPPQERFNWGHYIKFIGASFSEGYRAPCGNDTNIHHNEGDWSYDLRTRILRTSVPMYKDFRKALVDEVTEDRLVLTVPMGR